ncbi:arylsulfatase B [Anastrepha obliqua]|uniref:arylsulfatase B n=1 Tax=Anastrepha obliqua TaxID=95512 RepID=UPI002409A09E|nr:arylsulfatase B [Anastrepha obliqua]
MNFTQFLHVILLLCILISISQINANNSEEKRPHIIFILADDLGFNDVGFHGSAQIPTPNIDALAFSGLILNNYYVNPICTPSRAALMTGKYPIHTGMQHTVLYGAEPRGLPLTEKILPQYLNELGYSSHIAGKWHLGHYKNIYTPLQRGFKTHVGFWTGHHDFFDHTAVEHGMWGLDMRKGMEIGYEFHGKYTTDIVTDEAVRVIADHNATAQPLFLYVAHAAVHSGNPYNPLPAPDDVVAKLEQIEDMGRRRYAAMLVKLDESVGRIVQELQARNMLQDSIIVFSTDNGGPPQGFNLNHASNWPLRGVKNSMWEGGVRGAALLWSPRLQSRPRVAEQRMQIVDWLPTLLSAAGGVNAEQSLHNASAALDGLSIWHALSQDEPSPRRTILHNIDDIWGSAALTMGDWKLVVGTNYPLMWNGWYGPPGVRDAKAYDYKMLQRCPAGHALASLNMTPSVAEVIRMRSAATVNCVLELTPSACDYKGRKPCLYNVREDPCEYYNQAEKYPNILKTLLDELKRLNETAVPAANKPDDPRGDPRLHNYVWTNFGDVVDSEFVGKIE